MIILNKKRLIFINILVVFSIFFYSLSFQKENNIKLVSSTPVSGHTIILDAGHGKPDRSEQVEKMVL